MAKSDILLITFPFTDLSGTKLRPAVVLAEAGSDVIVCFITTQLQWQEPTDVLLYPSAINGLKKTSLIRTSKISTLHVSLIKGVLGKLASFEVLDINKGLKQLLLIP